MTPASFLSRNLELDWREGARHVLEHLVERDIALNNLSWQWMAGRGTGTNPHSLCMTRRGRQFDPHVIYGATRPSCADSTLPWSARRDASGAAARPPCLLGTDRAAR